jgi:D-glycero-D-manno-heptose 1,7-bisphosphate phosphatase
VSTPAAFLDRDGTLNVRPAEQEYVTTPADFRLLPGALEGVATLARCGYTPVVVSNQRGIGRGLVDRGTLDETERLIQTGLEPLGARVAAFSYCPHLIEDDCDCRKPRPGLLLRAAEELDLDLAASWMIGDSPSDIEAGLAAGCRPAFVGPAPPPDAALAAATLHEVARKICSDSARERGSAG